MNISAAISVIYKNQNEYISMNNVFQDPLFFIEGRPLTVIGRWSSVVGRWSLVIGRWSLVVGRWSVL